MSVVATVTGETRTTEREVAAERFLEALWGIHLGESSPRMWTGDIPCTYEDGVGEWLYRLWGMGGAPYLRDASR
jgi:hypothetical protein